MRLAARRAQALALSVLETRRHGALGPPSWDPGDPALWAALADALRQETALATALEAIGAGLPDPDRVRAAVRDLFDAADTLWPGAGDWSAAERRRQQQDDDLERLLATLVPPPILDLPTMAERALAMVADDLEGEDLVEDLDLGRLLSDLAEGAPPALGRSLLGGSLGSEGRWRRRVELVWEVLTPAAWVWFEEGAAPPAWVAELGRVAVLIEEQPWPPPDPPPPPVGFPAAPAGFAAADLVWPLLGRAHQPDWVAWRSDVPEARALVKAPARRLAEVLLGIAHAVVAPTALGLAEDRGKIVRRTLTTLMDKRFGVRARFVLGPDQAASLARILEAREEPVPRWLSDPVLAALKRSTGLDPAVVARIERATLG